MKRSANATALIDVNPGFAVMLDRPDTSPGRMGRFAALNGVGSWMLERTYMIRSDRMRQ